MKYLLAGVLAVVSAYADMVVYPDYPDAIERDYAYRVKVTQGSRTSPLVVWNHCEKSILAGRTHGGDVNRRFCEFAFAGEPVRVDIAVSEDVKSYAVFPSRLRLKSAFKDGVISVWLEKPEYFGIRLNDYDKSVLTVLADEPEKTADIPKKGASGVMYIEGWHDAVNEDGTLVVSNDVKEVYLAPGSVLNARLYVKSKGCRVHGRGIILDPLSDIFRFDQSKNRLFGTFRIDAPNVTVEDVKLVDARSFNWIFGPPGARVRNTKTFSSMMCSDGMSFWGGRDCVVEHCWVYSGDNGLVLSGTDPLVIRDTTVGTSCAAIFPQSSFKGPNILENVSVFRSDEGLINNYYNGVEPVEKRHAQTINVLFRDFSAVDTVQFAWIFQGHNMGHRPKTLVFDNASFPEPSGVPDYNGIGKKGIAIKMANSRDSLPTSNYHLFFTNLFVGGSAVTSAGLPPERVLNAATNEIVYATRSFAGEVPLVADRHEVDWACPASRRLSLPKAVVGENLVAETKKAHSIWQRCPSYRTRLEADHDRDNPVYHVCRTRPGAGMQANLTEKVLALGNGTYRLVFEAKAMPAEGKTSPVTMNAKLLSNEKTFAKTVQVGAEWRRVELEFTVDFDLAKTKLVSLFLQFPAGVGNADIKKINFFKKGACNL